MPSEADATDVIVVRAPRSVPRVIWRLSLVAMLVVVGVLLALVGGVLGWAVVTERLRRPPALVLSGGKRVPLNPFEEPWRRVRPAAQELAVILGVPSDSWSRVEERGPKLPGRRR